MNDLFRVCDANLRILCHHAPSSEAEGCSQSPILMKDSSFFAEHNLLIENCCRTCATCMHKSKLCLKSCRSCWGYFKVSFHRIPIPNLVLIRAYLSFVVRNFIAAGDFLKSVLNFISTSILHGDYIRLMTYSTCTNLFVICL